ncbi:MAG: hypothetical protein KatS3mg102_1636 [Planctomycetota bacterium]|nr:MAG: hypothetical protein KatS3mg102_1636 [Planctomycetota bacterium]
MAYTVFARKYRPQRFSEVVGQQAIAATLRNAVAQDRVAHAYLFCGPRGTGKTSLARILAKALNCLELQDGEPCNRCDPCVSITEGRNLDVDEFDAASNRKVEDAEALTQRVRAPRPARRDSRYKVFIVDEVHMMTKHAFNALLKTLEEPPPHVKFVFCTTEPEQVLETITSRCQRFDFRRIGREDIAARLAQICAAEGIEAEPRALRLIAARARGGMRDAQSLLDQAVALAAEPDRGSGAAAGGPLVLRAERLEAALGMAPREQVRALLEAVARGALPEVLAILDGLYERGLDPLELVAQTARLVRDCLVLELAGAEAGARLLEEPAEAEGLAGLAARLGRERALAALGALAELEQRLRGARDDRVLVELCLLELARLGEVLELEAVLARLEALEARLGGSAGPAAAPAAGGAAVAPPPAARAEPPGAAGAGAAPAAAAPSGPPADASARAGAGAGTGSGSLAPAAIRAAWDRALLALAEQRALVAALRAAAPVGIEPGGALLVRFERPLDLKRLFDERGAPRPLAEQLAQALGRELGCPVALRGELAEAPRASASRRPRSREEVLQEPEVRRVLERSRGGALLGFEELRAEDDEG